MAPGNSQHTSPLSIFISDFPYLFPSHFADFSLGVCISPKHTHTHTLVLWQLLKVKKCNRNTESSAVMALFASALHIHTLLSE